jgi:hypothetical protein
VSKPSAGTELGSSRHVASHRRPDGARLLPTTGGSGRLGATYRGAAELEALKRSAGEDPRRLSGHPADVTDETAVRAIVDEVVARHGRLDAVLDGRRFCSPAVALDASWARQDASSKAPPDEGEVDS